jgi:hypothetical protein
LNHSLTKSRLQNGQDVPSPRCKKIASGAAGRSSSKWGALCATDLPIFRRGLQSALGARRPMVRATLPKEPRDEKPKEAPSWAMTLKSASDIRPEPISWLLFGRRRPRPRMAAVARPKEISPPFKSDFSYSQQTQTEFRRNATWVHASLKKLLEHRAMSGAAFPSDDQLALLFAHMGSKATRGPFNISIYHKEYFFWQGPGSQFIESGFRRLGLASNEPLSTRH